MARVGKAAPVEAEEVVEAEETPVDDYPERPYSEAVSDEHREYLKSQGVDV